MAKKPLKDALQDGTVSVEYCLQRISPTILFRTKISEFKKPFSTNILNIVVSYSTVLIEVTGSISHK